ncbi:radical SAM protein [Streptomyces niveiscabiei]|uniref:radical SAM protein n=1 Tax=Streptomyces niveiscabiei TaxID=164115 RepID=UPI0029B6436A|nr:radical SAM protein [Streptomyces niveiscabiei]MDX3386775.1 radical SAM protein [Streptomyces niveiscabiei]
MKVAENPLKFAWLEVTGLCNELCDHCYADSGPKGTRGTMTVKDWVRVISELSEIGTCDVQFIGGEPALYPYLPALIRHAHASGLSVEIFSNMTHIRAELWNVIRECGVKIATSYYSDSAEKHDAVTNLRGSHRRTRANIEKALSLGVPVRGGVVAVHSGQRAFEATQDLLSIGVEQVGADRIRAFGRGSSGAAPNIADLCGHCAHEKCAIGPDGNVWPCVLGRFLTIGNVRESPLSEIWGGLRMGEVLADIRAVLGNGAQSCTPPQFLPMCGPCGPCPPSVGHCDPSEADNPATLGTPF